MDGILIVDKPAGWTSHDVVARARRLLKEKRVGHTGTLDPFATGVLVLLVGRATRLAQFLSGAEKEYLATVRLGYATDTGDLTGTPLPSVEAQSGFDCASVGASEVEAALARLRGEIEQVPPMYSAKKVEGRKLYELARRGETVERKAVRVSVPVFETVAGAGGRLFKSREDGTCDFEARVVCSAGTYVRALAESAGELLGTGAHLAALRRTRAGEFGLDAAVTLDELQTKSDAGAGAARDTLVTTDAALSFMPAAHLTAQEAQRVRHGAAVRAAAPEDISSERPLVRLLGEDGELLGVGLYDFAAGVLRPRVTLAADEK